jgi:hypothetical protein
MPDLVTGADDDRLFPWQAPSSDDLRVLINGVRPVTREFVPIHLREELASDLARLESLEWLVGSLLDDLSARRRY